MNTASSSYRGTTVAIAVLFAVQVMLTGCASFPGKSPELPPPPLDPNAPTYKVIMQGKSGEAEVFTGTINQQMTIEDALKESGAIKRHRSMLVDVARVAQGGQVLRLPVTYNGGTKTVLVEQNYALLPGDEILVRSDGRGPLDTVIQTITGNERKRDHLSPIN